MAWMKRRAMRPLGPHELLGHRHCDLPYCFACWLNEPIPEASGRPVVLSEIRRLTPTTLRNAPGQVWFQICRAPPWPLPLATCPACGGAVLMLEGQKR